MTPRLTSVYFGGGQYPRLARVLEATAREHCPGWDVDVREVGAWTFPSADRNVSSAANAHKLLEWHAVVRRAPDGARLLFLDADTFVTAPLDPLWDIPFDFAYTVRPPASRLPFNAGVVAVRTTLAGRAVFDAWAAQDEAFRVDAAAHAAARQVYGGMNQASLGRVLEHPPSGAIIAALPCRVWNCEDDAWSQFGPETRIVHVKGALRLACFGLAMSARVRSLALLWRHLDNAAERA